MRNFKNMQQLQKEVRQILHNFQCDNGDHELCNPRGHLALTSVKLKESAECAFVCEGLIMGPSNLGPALSPLVLNRP